MANTQILDFKLRGDWLLGAYPRELSRLCQISHDTAREPPDHRELRLTIEAEWYDPTLLCLFAQTITSASTRFKRVDLRLPTLHPAKAGFLWRAEFWPTIRANAEGSNVSVTPDPWPFRRPSLEAMSSNHTFLLTYRIGDGQLMSEEAADDWDRQLTSTVVASALSHKDLLFTKEYLYVVMWELLSNAEAHSNGTHVSVFGQLFPSDEDLGLIRSHCAALQASRQTTFGERVLDTDRLVYQLKNSRQRERSLNAPRARRDWLQHQQGSYLLISCIDNGVGIPHTVRSHTCTTLSDKAAMEAAFREDVSTRHLAKGMFDVHGLPQILRLVNNYGGHLFMQSGQSVAATDAAGSLFTSPISASSVLPGTLCQVLMPLSHLVPCQQPTPVQLPSPPHPATEVPETPRNVLHVADELGAEVLRRIPAPSSWHELCAPLFTRARDAEAPLLYVDLARLPRNRQFISYILRYMRRARAYKGMVVINASEEIGRTVRSMSRLDHGQIPEAEACFEELEADLANAISRTRRFSGLPLLLPFTSGGDRPDNYDLLWVGLSSLRSPWREGVERVLNHLFHQDGTTVDLDEVSRIGCEHIPDAAEMRDTFLKLFFGVCQCNLDLIERTEDACRMTISKWDIHTTASSSIQESFVSRTVPAAQYAPPSEYKNFLYFMPWHTEKKRFRTCYYRTWNVLADRHHLEITAQHLLRKAHAVLGEQLLLTTDIVSVTPSAGLLARRLAKALHVNCWETGSLHDIRAEEWLPELTDSAVLIVDDVIDTGKESRINNLNDSDLFCRYQKVCQMLWLCNGSETSTTR